MEPVAIMASKKSVNAENLAALGAQRLAAILMDLAEHDAETKRRLRLELAGQAGGEIIAAEISKRLTSLKSARSFVDWHKRRDFVKDLDLQRTMIVDRLAPTRPDLALDLMWRFLDLAEPVLNRVDDSNGTVGDVFRAACNDLGAIASAAKPDPARLAERVFEAVTRNDYGVLDNLVRAICPALGEAGMAQLKARLTAAQAKRPATDRFDGRSYALRAALQDIADAEGNVDAYIALVPASARKQPGVAAEIGHRLLKAGRAEEALAALEPAAPKRHGSYLNDDLYYPGYEGPWPEWEEAYLEALDATGQRERAQPRTTPGWTALVFGARYPHGPDAPGRVRLAYRQTEGLMGSIMRLLGLISPCRTTPPCAAGQPPWRYPGHGRATPMLGARPSLCICWWTARA